MKYRVFISIIIVLTLVVFSILPHPSNKKHNDSRDEITVFAAASLAGALEQIVGELTEDAGRELQLCHDKTVYLVFKSHSVNVTAIKET